MASFFLCVVTDVFTHDLFNQDPKSEKIQIFDCKQSRTFKSGAIHLFSHKRCLFLREIQKYRLNVLFPLRLQRFASKYSSVTVRTTRSGGDHVTHLCVFGHRSQAQLHSSVFDWKCVVHYVPIGPATTSVVTTIKTAFKW